ncbi:hypothetical protein GCM10025868_34620 [Angustibacter aerolatus]|uniref:Histidine kinase/HSP90-like ATPase domain-containing protein n=1 Tax=Angustibacter aerolatus TaxID=1162965 RepID=A0ABQ6JIY7_9ACTN|nr:hypothetical protein GCM10025868_34620 [Angustibacter aerolatus]
MPCASRSDLGADRSETHLVASRRFACEPRVGSAVRRFVAEQTADVASLVPSLDVEPGGHRVVTNVVLHARTDFEVRLLRRDGVVRLEVQDGSSALLRPGTLADTAMSGRGLMMVQALASRWGVEHLPAGASSSGASLGGEVDPAEVGAEQAGAGVDG